ncbi:MAG: hypothetical protein ACOY58_03435 [Candidatus Micrarchaeota archaeon]
MSEKRDLHNSFVLRIWWEDAQSQHRFWRGKIQHAASGESAYVQTFDDLRAFIEARTGCLRDGEPED